MNSIVTPDVKRYAAELLKYMMQKLHLEKLPTKLHFRQDKANAQDLFGYTGYYNPETKEITIYITDRLHKDILRSIAHEMVHYWQDANGTLDVSGYVGGGYAQKNPKLRQREKQAYLLGNILFRDWCDFKKQSKPKKNR